MFTKGGKYLHIIDLAGFHIASVLICNIIFLLDLSFCVGSDLLNVQGKEKKNERQVLHERTSWTSLSEVANVFHPHFNQTNLCRDVMQYERTDMQPWGKTQPQQSPLASRRPLLSCFRPQCPHCHYRRWNSYLLPWEPFCAKNKKQNQKEKADASGWTQLQWSWLLWKTSYTTWYFKRNNLNIFTISNKAPRFSTL